MSHLDDAELVRAYEQSLELTRQIGRALRTQRARTTRRIMQAVMESDEAAATFGAPCCDPRPVAKGHECSTHAFAAIQCSGGVCSEAMDDLE